MGPEAGDRVRLTVAVSLPSRFPPPGAWALGATPGALAPGHRSRCPAYSPWDSRGAGTLGSHERPVVAGTPPTRGAARPPVSPAATIPLSLTPPGLTPSD